MYFKYLASAFVGLFFSLSTISCTQKAESSENPAPPISEKVEGPMKLTGYTYTKNIVQKDVEACLDALVLDEAMKGDYVTNNGTVASCSISYDYESFINKSKIFHIFTSILLSHTGNSDFSKMPPVIGDFRGFKTSFWIDSKNIGIRILATTDSHADIISVDSIPAIDDMKAQVIPEYFNLVSKKSKDLTVTLKFLLIER